MSGIQIDEKTNVVTWSVEEYEGLVRKIQELDMRLMKIERSNGNDTK